MVGLFMAIEKRGELVVGIEREHMRNVLVWTDDGDAALLPIDTPCCPRFLSGLSHSANPTPANAPLAKLAARCKSLIAISNLGGAISGGFYGNTSNAGASPYAPANGHGVTPSESPGPQVLGGGGPGTGSSVGDFIQTCNAL